MDKKTNGTLFLREYAKECAEQLMKTDFEALSEMADIILEAKHNGKRILTAGNGGSAATASHICNDLLKGTRVYGRIGFSAMCLGDSLPVLTCLANDFSYEDIYRIQMETTAQEGDVFLAFSGSGNSENVIRAAICARERGVKVLGFSGRDGGKLKNLCDISVIAPTDCMEMIEDMHMLYCHSLVQLLKSRLAEEWGAEILHPAGDRNFKTAVFDFDGTVSLIRADWREAMIPYFTDVLVTEGRGLLRKEAEELVNEFVDALTGKQTIFQCIALDETVEKYGGEHRNPQIYKQGFLDRMQHKVTQRKEELRSGTKNPEAFLVPGAKELVASLEQHGVKCYLASGTDEEYVREEAALLGVDTLFSGGIYGAKPGQTEGVKEALLKELVQSGEVCGREILCFGDGPSELNAVKTIGGYAVAVALDEKRPCAVDERKRDLLLKANPDMVIADYSDLSSLLKLLKLH
jgi:phosphoheptose isomerase/phosphoglycolate phosphatase-like HAD superfamily hydrolase